MHARLLRALNTDNPHVEWAAIPERLQLKEAPGPNPNLANHEPRLMPAYQQATLQQKSIAQETL